MEYSIKVNRAKNAEDGVKGFASVVFGDSFKITSIVVMEKNGKLYVSMPRYKSNEKDESGKNIYKDVCNPITKEFREKLYGDILKAYEEEDSPIKGEISDNKKNQLSQNLR